MPTISQLSKSIRLLWVRKPTSKKESFELASVLSAFRKHKIIEPEDLDELLKANGFDKYVVDADDDAF